MALLNLNGNNANKKKFLITGATGKAGGENTRRHLSRWEIRTMDVRETKILIPWVH